MNKENEQIEKKRRILLIVSVVYITIFILFLLNTFIVSDVMLKDITSTFIIFLVFIIGFVGLYFVTRKIMKTLKNNLMANISDVFNETKFAADIGIPEIIFRDANFIKKYDKYYSSNCIAGKIENSNRFSICDIKVSEIIREKEETREVLLFSGIFGMIATKNNYTFDMNITPDIKNKYINQILDNIKKLAGVKDVVRLENPEFERYFEVYSDNQIEARKVITVNFMEKLLDLRKRINKNITITYVRNNIYFFIENGKIINENKLLLKGVTDEIIKSTSDNMKLILETMNLL